MKIFTAQPSAFVVEKTSYPPELPKPNILLPCLMIMLNGAHDNLDKDVVQKVMQLVDYLSREALIAQNNDLVAAHAKSNTEPIVG